MQYIKNYQLWSDLERVILIYNNIYVILTSKLNMCKKVISFIFILFFAILSSNFAYSDSCDFGYEIGNETRELKEDFGITEEGDINSIMPRFSLPSVQVELVYICPGEDLDDGLLHILMFENEIAGFYLEKGSFKEENSDEPILAYIKENYANDFDFDSLDWDKRRAVWTTAKNEKFIYYKEDRDTFIDEQLLITEEKYQDYIMDISDKEAGMYVE